MLYPPGAVERAMHVHEIITRALDGQLTWIQAAEIRGRSPRSIRRLRQKLAAILGLGLEPHRPLQHTWRSPLPPRPRPSWRSCSWSHDPIWSSG